MSAAIAFAADDADNISVSIANTMDQLQAVFALRAVVYMGEQNCPYDEEFDGNDLAGATHLIAREGRQPVGVCRIRWFNGFAKLERVAVVRGRRNGRVVRALWKATEDLAARKGFRYLLGHVEPALLAFWERCAGLKRRVGRPSFYFSDREYVETLAELPLRNDALDLDSEPLVLLRPEGRWDNPGVLDVSSQRRAAGR